jgi:hypothetical protein
MALWRDPLDELIGDLERTLPPEVRRGNLQLPRLEDVQLLVGAILDGSEETLLPSRCRELAPLPVRNRGNARCFAFCCGSLAPPSGR